MEFTVNKETLLDALTKVQGITGKKTNILITSNVLLSAEDSSISIRATDLEMAFKTVLQGEVRREGSTAIPSRKIYEIVRAFPRDVLVVKEIENKWIRIADEKIEYSIVGMEPSDFPGFPDVSGAELFEMEVKVLKNMISKTIHSVLGDEGRAQLSGICFERVIVDNLHKIRMVSTDGHRLSMADHPMADDRGLVLKQSVIIPKSGVAEVLRIIEDGESVQIGFKDSNFLLKKGEEVLIVRLIDGEFPDYKMVIPKAGGHQMSVEKEAFLMMLRRMSILSSEKYPGVRFKIDKTSLEAKTTNPEIGESRESLSVSYDGEPFEVAFNPRYFIETLNSMQSEEVVVRFKDEVNPCILEGKDDPDFLSVIMPMRV